MKRSFTALLFLAAVLGALAATNPGREELAATIDRAAEERSTNALDRAAHRVGAAIDKHNVEVRSYLFFSVGQVAGIGEDDLYLGALGRWYHL